MPVKTSHELRDVPRRAYGARSLCDMGSLRQRPQAGAPNLLHQGISEFALTVLSHMQMRHQDNRKRQKTTDCSDCRASEPAEGPA